MEFYPFQISDAENREYIFVTKDGIAYEVGFCEVSDQVKNRIGSPLPEIYETYIYPIVGEPQQLDFRVMNTFSAICFSFMHANILLYYRCDISDGKQAKRQLLFERKFNQMCDESSEYKLITKQVVTHNKTYYSAIIASCLNPHFWRLEKILNLL